MHYDIDEVMETIQASVDYEVYNHLRNWKETVEYDIRLYQEAIIRLENDLSDAYTENNRLEEWIRELE